MTNEIFHTSILQFCQYLCSDVEACLEEWARFTDYEDLDFAKRKEILSQKVMRLKELIAEREEWFGENRCFL